MARLREVDGLAASAARVADGDARTSTALEYLTSEPTERVPLLRNLAEAGVLENHGYWLADAAIRVHVPDLLPAQVPPLNVPHPDWAGPEDKIKEALKDSSKRALLGHS